MTTPAELKGQDAGSRLPDGCRWVRLGEVCKIVAKQVDPKMPEYGALPHVNGENIESGRCRLTYLHTAAEERMISGKYLFEAGDVLYSKLRPYLRKALVADFRGVCSADMYPIRVNPECLSPHFTAWMLVSDEFTKYADEESRRARMPKLNREQLFAWRMPLPPLADQRRIVAQLSAQMASVERARCSAEAQLQAAEALPAAYLRAVFASPEARAWPKKRLGEVGKIVSGITLGRKLNGAETRRVPYLRVANVKDGHLDLTDVYEIEATEPEVQKWRLTFGDLLLTEGGDRDKLGRGTFWQEQISECIHQNHIFRVRFDCAQFSPQFVSAQIASSYGKAYFLAHAKQTTGIATINQKVLAGFPLMIPPPADQRHIASELSSQMASAERLRQTLADQLDTINKLPAALLRKAFCGKL